MTDISLPRLRCYRCFYEWVPRKTHVPACPRCRSKLYATPKIRSVRLGQGLGIKEILAPKRKEVYQLARRYGVRRVSVFGSIRRSEGDANSDVDLLVEWKRGQRPLDRLELAIALEHLLGRRVDLASKETLPWSLLPQISSEAIEL